MSADIEAPAARSSNDRNGHLQEEQDAIKTIKVVKVYKQSFSFFLNYSN